MSDLPILFWCVMISSCIVSILGDLEVGVSAFTQEYESFKNALEHFRTSMNEACEELEEFDQMKVSLDKFLSSRSELCKTKILPKVYINESSTNGCPWVNLSGQSCVLNTGGSDWLDIYTLLAQKYCASIKAEFPDATDGVYRIKPRDGKPSFLAYCDMMQQGGGWLVIQRRQDGSEDFYRTWFEYMSGFGNLTGEFWLGNEKIHRLTTQGKYELRVDLEKKKGDTKFAQYRYFRVANMSEFYNLTIDGYSGNAGDGLTYHNNTRFSAKNLDLDNYTLNCAQTRHGAWWFRDRSYSHLNGLYTGSSDSGVYWSGNYKKSSMKIRPVQ